MQDHTFVITVYRESPYLAECLQSLLNQTVKSKIIMATSTPSDFSQNMALTHHIPYFINDTDDTGARTNWNFALACGDTKLVTIVHQDDTYENNYTQQLLSNVARYKKDDLLIAFTGYTDLVNGLDRNFSLSSTVKSALLMPFLFSRVIKSKYLKKLVLLFGNPICCPSVTFNMAYLKHFEFTDDYKSIYDWFAWYELAGRTGGFLYINKRLIKRRLHAGSGTIEVTLNNQKQTDELHMFERMWGKYPARVLMLFYHLGNKDNMVK